MSYQGNTIITMTTANTITRGELISGAGTLSASLKPIGVCYDIVDTDCQVAISGTVLVLLAATLTAGALFISNGDGHAIAHTTGTDAVAGDDDLVCGIILVGGDSGELVTAKLT